MPQKPKYKEIKFELWDASTGFSVLPYPLKAYIDAEEKDYILEVNGYVYKLNKEGKIINF